MPPSQLKRLKASLREQGIVGSQKSKKEKKQNAQNGPSKEKRVNRTAALSGIREQFNPFEYKTSARGPKFDVTTNRTLSGRITKSTQSRPGVAKSLGEEQRRHTLLIDMQHKNKMGGITDRRFGENDPTMAPEEKMMERFIQEKQRRHKNKSAFDLEDEYEPAGLTHMGQSLSFDGPLLKDDFDEEGLDFSDAEEMDEEQRSKKRRRLSDTGDSHGGDDDEVPDMPERKKTKQEVMKEVMAKSKLYKYERQAAKEDDEDLREELDKELVNIQDLLRGVRPKATPISESGMDPARLALLNGDTKLDFSKEYDKRVRQLAQDQKSKPTQRTKPEEERLAEESKRLQELETRRLRRMEGEKEDSDSEQEAQGDESDGAEEGAEDEDTDEFGLGSGIKVKGSRAELGVEDEDDFYIEDDLIASGSDISDSDEDEEISEAEDDDDSDQDEEDEEDEDDEFTRPEFLTGANGFLEVNEAEMRLPYPHSHADFLDILKLDVVQDFPLDKVIKKIRFDHKQNKAQLRQFAMMLVDHIPYLANHLDTPHFVDLEKLIRHVQSMSKDSDKQFSIEISNAFRRQLESIQKSRALSLNSGDLVILTAIGTIFPTSDHFHQVVTPAILTLGRHLGQKIPQTVADFATAAYLSTLAIQYQRLSKRYIPEVINSILNTLCALAPVKMSKIPGNFPYHEPKQPLRLERSVVKGRNLTFIDTTSRQLNAKDEDLLKAALLETNVKLLDAAAEIWSAKSSFTEVFEPSLKILQHLNSKACRDKLPESSKTFLTHTITKVTTHLHASRQTRRPLLLHNHKPLAIKTQIPKFEESFNPDKHYDPDRTISEAKKETKLLKKDMKKMMRQLRGDSNFIARNQLKEKRAKDEAHEKKEKRLIAEIQGEEGRESKNYEREKEWRKKGKK